MADKTELLDAVHDMRAAAMSAGSRVEDVAMLLGEVGLDRLADRLMDAIAPLQECSRRMLDAYGEKLRDDLSYSQTMTGNMLMLALKAATERSA